MPRCDGVTATRLIVAERPEVRIVMLTMSADDEDLFAAIQSGACGYLLKTDETDVFFGLLMGAAAGEVVLSPGLASKLLRALAGRGPAAGPGGAGPASALTPRQMEVLTLVAQGMTYKEVGAHLGLTERTIKYHMGEIVALLHLENRAQVLEYARRSGLLRS